MNLLSIFLVLGVGLIFFILLLIPAVIIMVKLRNGSMVPRTAKIFAIFIVFIVLLIFVAFMGMLKSVQG